MDNRALLLLLLIVLFVALAWLVQIRHRNTIRQQRRSMWDQCLQLFEQAELVQDDVNFPVLNGTYAGHRVTLEPIVDHVAYRKLPQLWLRATVYIKLPLQGIFDYLVRPENIEFYSAIWSLPITLPVPQSWPQHAVLRTDSVERMPPESVIAPHIRMFDDPKMKELVITPKGARTVYQLNEGQRAYYAVLRSPQFAEIQVRPDTIETLLARILALAADLSKAAVT